LGYAISIFNMVIELQPKDNVKKDNDYHGLGL